MLALAPLAVLFLFHQFLFQAADARTRLMSVH